jgi:hypothetical protein
MFPGRQKHNAAYQGNLALFLAMETLGSLAALD